MSYDKCSLCPRSCGVNRTNGEKGFCGAGSDIKIGRYSLHYWEEPCISGENGSGAVFFSHCTLRCVYCQNYKISTKHCGNTITPEELSDIFLSLQSSGAHNINLVTPTHYVPGIIKALDTAKVRGLSLPVIYNTSGYESVDTLKMLEGYIDIYMPDFKYYRESYAKKYSNAPDYTKVVKSAIAEMTRQVLPLEYNGEMLKKGVIVRHLLLPGQLYDAKKILDYLYSMYENDIIYSIMSQYTPLPHIAHVPELNKKIGIKEYNVLCDYASRIGIENAYIQSATSSDSCYIPDFCE